MKPSTRIKFNYFSAWMNCNLVQRGIESITVSDGVWNCSTYIIHYYSCHLIRWWYLLLTSTHIFLLEYFCWRIWWGTGLKAQENYGRESEAREITSRDAHCPQHTERKDIHTQKYSGVVLRWNWDRHTHATTWFWSSRSRVDLLCSTYL